MERLLIDTSIIVRYLKSADGVLKDILGSYDLVISAVTVAELMATNRASDQAARSQLQDFLAKNFTVLPCTDRVAIAAGELLRTLDDITLAHAFIAATALSEDLPLLSYDIKVFDSVPDLKIVDM